jgi:hypothetical protein
MKPSKSDFPNFVPFPAVIPDDLINPRIYDAFKFDIRPKLETLADDILALSGTGSPQLKAFYDDYVLHWWVLLAYKRFIEFHGKNVTQYGITKTKDPAGTFEPIGVEERAVILKQLQSDANTLYTLILAQEWKFDGSVYRRSSCKGPSTDFGINAIG